MQNNPLLKLLLKSSLQLSKKISSNRLLMTLICLTLISIVTLPRFNEQNLIPFLKNVGNKGHLGELTIDGGNYINMVEYFRSDLPSSEFEIFPPFTYRPLQPFIASFLPFSAMTSFNLVSVFCIAIGVLYLWLILGKLKISPQISFISLFLAIFSFPVFFFGAANRIDAMFIMFLMMSVYYALNSNFLFYLITIALGSLSKETIILSLPFYFFLQKDNRNKYYKTFFALIIFIFFSYLSRTIIPASQNIFWYFDLESIISNLSRHGTYLDFILGHGFLLFLIPLSFRHFKKRGFTSIEKSLFVGVVLTEILYLYAIVSAYPDTRFLWPLYCFALPLSAIYLNETLVLNSEK